MNIKQNECHENIAKEKNDIEKVMSIMDSMMIKGGKPVPANEKGIDALIEQKYKLWEILLHT